MPPGAPNKLTHCSKTEVVESADRRFRKPSANLGRFAKDRARPHGVACNYRVQRRRTRNSGVILKSALAGVERMRLDPVPPFAGACAAHSPGVDLTVAAATVT